MSLNSSAGLAVDGGPRDPYTMLRFFFGMAAQHMASMANPITRFVFHCGLRWKTLTRTRGQPTVMIARRISETARQAGLKYQSGFRVPESKYRN